MQPRPVRPLVGVLLAQFVSFAVVLPGLAQERQDSAPRVVTADDYARAEKFLTYNTTPLALHVGVRPTWLKNDRFWYRDTVVAGNEFVVFDAARGSRGPAFDHARLAAALSSAAGAAYDAFHLPFTQFELLGRRAGSLLQHRLPTLAM